MKKDPRVDAYIADAAQFARPILKRLRKIVHAGCPEVQETIKWSVPNFEYKGILCGMAAFKQHCAFYFWKGSLLGLDRQKVTQAMGHLGRITSPEDLPSDEALIRLVKQAAALNDAGVKVTRRKIAPKAPGKPPSDFLAALRTNRKALATFEAFSPSQRREYIDWIIEARSEETRQRRLQTAIEWLGQGKVRNWKYTAPRP